MAAPIWAKSTLEQLAARQVEFRREAPHSPEAAVRSPSEGAFRPGLRVVVIEPMGRRDVRLLALPLDEIIEANEGFSNPADSAASRARDAGG